MNKLATLGIGLCLTLAACAGEETVAHEGDLTESLFPSPSPLVIDIELASAPPNPELTNMMTANTVQLATLEDTSVNGVEVTYIDARGSAVLIGDGLIATAGHVTIDDDGAHDCRDINAQILYSDSALSNNVDLKRGSAIYDPSVGDAQDIAIYALDDSYELPADHTLPAISSSELQIGQVVLFSNYQQRPEASSRISGFEPPVLHSGVVATIPTNENEPVAVVTGLTSFDESGETTSFGGASGGPVFDRGTGELVGISVASQGKGYAFEEEFVNRVLGIDLEVVNGDVERFGITYIVTTTNEGFVDRLNLVSTGQGELCD